jgi:hypothetical protein
MFEGRKLLKNVATRYELVSVPTFALTCWACSRRLQRHTLTRITPRYSASAAASQRTDAVRTVCHRRAKVHAGH